MYFKGLFRKKLSIKEGDESLTEYCEANGFDDNATHWKKLIYSKHWFAYHKHTNSIIGNGNNRVTYIVS